MKAAVQLSCLVLSASGLVAGGLDAWHERTVPGPGTVLTHGTFGHAGFVVAGNNGTILCSEDGVEWAAHTTHSNHFFYGVAYGKGIYVVAGANQGDHTAGIVLSSTDGKAWTRQQLPSANAILMSAAFLDNRFVLVGAAGVLFVSTNAVSWRSMSSWGDSDFAYGVTAGQGRMVVVGGEVAQIGVFEEDILWKVLRVEGAFKLRGAAYGNNRFVAVGGVLRPDVVLSADGRIWERQKAPETLGAVDDVCFAAARFVAVGEYGYKILSSRNGADWTSHVTGHHNNLRGICFGRNTFLAVGSGPVILQSDPVQESER